MDPHVSLRARCERSWVALASRSLWRHPDYVFLILKFRGGQLGPHRMLSHNQGSIVGAPRVCRRPHLVLCSILAALRFATPCDEWSLRLADQVCIWRERDTSLFVCHLAAVLIGNTYIDWDASPRSRAGSSYLRRIHNVTMLLASVLKSLVELVYISSVLQARLEYFGFKMINYHKH